MVSEGADEPDVTWSSTHVLRGKRGYTTLNHKRGREFYLPNRDPVETANRFITVEVNLLK